MRAACLALGLLFACAPRGEATPQFPELLAELERRHSPERVTRTLEVLPVLTAYAAEPDVADGVEAAERHFESLPAEGRRRFGAHVARVLLYVELFQLLGADLGNGYHDVAFALPESRHLYRDVLEHYALDREEATAYDVASSLSTLHEAHVAVALAAFVAELREEERIDYLARFLGRIREIRAAGAR